MKTLLLDIETSPITAYTWGLWNQNINIKAIVDSGGVLCWAAKWYNDTNIMYRSILNGKKKMLKEIHALLDEADVVIHYNGTKFDIPVLNKEFVVAGMSPPAPFAQIDLLKTARKHFKFPSNKLDYVSKALGYEGKLEHEGFDLWIKCMKKDKEAWHRMEAYNMQDVLVLEDVYTRLLPWITNHPNHGVVHDIVHACPSCGSNKVQRRGYNFTQSGRYQRFQCTHCGAWSQSRYSDKIDKEVLKSA